MRNWLVDRGVLIQKSFESSRCDGLRRTPSYFPVLKSANFRWESCGNQSRDRLGLAQFIALTPRLEAPDNGSDSLFIEGYFGPLLLRKEFVKRCRGDRMRRRARYFPLLKRAELQRQASLDQGSNCLRLTEIVCCSPGLELSDHRRELRRVACHQPVMMAIPPQAGNS